MVNPANNTGRTLEDFTIPASQRTEGPQLGQQDFMKIMIEQLRGQNPLEPQDNNQFFAQMVQFQSLDAMVAMQQAITNLAQVSDLANATALIGKTVTANVPQGTDAHGMPLPDSEETGEVQTVTFDEDGAVLHLDTNVAVPAGLVTKVS
ncbi:MAG: flagellar hook capping FlgD N-terminal domain-containing protein [Dehalococcoidia bacterium]